MARLRKRDYAEEAFQMAPMIDMVFLLLVFFMTVSNLAQADRVELELPQSEEAQVPDNLDDRGIVSIDDEGQIFVGATPHSLATMQALISDAVAENPEIRIFVRAGKNVQYGEVRRVLKACAEAGAYAVIYATYQK